MAKDRRITFIIGANIKNFKKGLDSAQRRMQRFGRKMKRTGRSLTRTITAPLALAGGAAVKMASDFESSMTRIETLVGLSRTQVQGMRSDVLALSRETARAPKELSEALFTVTSAGLRGAESMEVLERAAKASAIGLGETREIARATTAIIQAYGKENMSAAQATDTLTAIVREGNLEASELAPVLGRVVGIASQLGVSFSEVGASIATFTRLGVSSEEAVTGLRGVMNALLKPTEQGRKALDEVGLSFEELRRQVQEEGLMATLRGLIGAFDGNVEGLSRVIPRVRALAAVMGTAGAQGEDYEQILNNIQDTTGIVDEGFERVSQTTQFKFNKALTSLKNTAIELGSILLPLANDVLVFVNKWVDRFNDLSDETKRMGLVIAGILGASGPILTALGFMITSLAAISWPVVLGVAALGAATAAIISKWDAVVAYFTKGEGAQFWKELKEIVQNTIDIITGAWELFGDELITLTEDSLDVIIKVFKRILGNINAAVRTWAAIFKGEFREAFRIVTGEAEQFSLDMVDIIKGIGTGLGKWLWFINPPRVAFSLLSLLFSGAGEEGDDMKERIKKNGYGAFEPIIDGALEASRVINSMYQRWLKLQRAIENASSDSEGEGQFTAAKGDGPSEKQPGLNFRFFPDLGVLDKVNKGLKKVKGNTDAVAAALGDMRGAWTAFTDGANQAIARLEQRWGDGMGALAELGARTVQMLGRLFGQLATGIGAAMGRALAGVRNEFKTGFEQIILIVLDFASNLANIMGAIGGLLMFINPGLGAGMLAAAAALSAIASGFRAGIEKRARNRRRRSREEETGNRRTVGDALIRSNGSIVRFHPDDNILAMKDFGNLSMSAGGGSAVINNYLQMDGRTIFLGSKEYEIGAKR